MQLTEHAYHRLASSSQEQILWIQVITEMTPEESLGLFPKKSPRLATPRAAELAQSMRTLRGELSQGGITLQDIAQQRPEDPRWKALLSLETRYLHAVSQQGITDRMIAQLHGATHPTLPRGVKRLVIAGVPDLPRVYDEMIPKISAQGAEVDLLVFNPASQGNEFFDALGRPSAAWGKIAIPIARSRIHLSLDHAEEGKKAAHLARASGGRGECSAIAITSTELILPIQDALKNLAITFFNPAGTSLDLLPLGRLLKGFSDLLRENDFPSALQLLRHADLHQWLNLHPHHDFQALDHLQGLLIPSSLDDLLTRWPTGDTAGFPIPGNLKKSLQIFQKTLLEMKQGWGSAPLLQLLRTITASTDLGRLLGGRESAEHIQAWIFGTESLMASIRSEDLLILLLSHLQSGVCTGEKKTTAIELLGWLELLWEDAPHLIVTGMNDGRVPEIRSQNSFLNEPIRRFWNLPSDLTRLHRDSYLLLSLIASRPESEGRRVDFLLAQQDDEGATLKPSRLLLKCAEEKELPRLVSELSQELPPRPSEKWHSTWALRPERKSPPASLSPSSLKDYLACPTRFYLKHVLKLRTKEFGMEEVDPATFGNLIHSTLREFGNNPTLKNLCGQEEIQKNLFRLWKNLWHTHYGADLAFSLLYQREVGIRRLKEAARVQAQSRAEGWEIVACERRFQDFPIGKMKLQGQIDRIDRRVTASGTEWRIIDYKSSESAKKPNAEHYRSLGIKDDPIKLGAYECFEHHSKPNRWIDLQLPIYRMVLLSEIALGNSSYLGLGAITSGSVEAGYFVLPSKVSDTEFLPFLSLEDHEQSARSCLEGILSAIQRGIFWPPRQPKYDDFQRLFFDHLESSALSGQQTCDPINLYSAKQEERETQA
jgi:ATP-dependent helicase/nuclease subunit B